ncbi:MAG: hypothetical protein LBK71_03380 [Verrucomicrobiales bacterium]|jgi:predicted DNA-binding protein|nr:hypothetical protein [Verrucomicrobiales bacterium]
MVRVKEKKNLQFTIKLENDLAQDIKNLSRQARMSMGEIVRLCVEQQLAQKINLQAFARERKGMQLSMRFEESLRKNLSKLSRKTGLSLGEIIRLCVTRHFAQIRCDGSIKIKVSPDGK